LAMRMGGMNPGCALCFFVDAQAFAHMFEVARGNHTKIQSVLPH
jgi:hypothetical protein